jgi:hypothetical protein
MEEEHPPTRLTLSQVVLVTRIPRSTLQRHIDADRLRQNPDGTIDAAALHQAFRIIHPNPHLRQRQEAQVRKGRPPKSTQIEQAQFQEDYRHTYYDIMKRTDRQPRQLDVAEELFISERTLRRYLKRGGLPWPPP